MKYAHFNEQKNYILNSTLRDNIFLCDYFSEYDIISIFLNTVLIKKLHSW